MHVDDILSGNLGTINEGDVVTLSGTLDKIQYVHGQQQLRMTGSKDPKSNSQYVYCKDNVFAHVTPGQEVTVKAKWEGNDLVEGEFVSAGPAVAPEMSATDFAAEYAADEEAAVEKYDVNWIRLTGEVAEVETLSPSAINVTLKGTDEVGVLCVLRDEDVSLRGEPKVGEQLTLMGTCTVVGVNDDGKVVVNGAHFTDVMPKPDE